MTTHDPLAPDTVSGKSPSRKAFRRVAAASMAGTALEYYDFSIYGLAASLVFAKVFFPNVDPSIALISSFATFGVGFAARPIGGIIFGHLGDRFGRKNILIVTLVTMGTCTALIGCLPTYGQIGVWAPILLVVIRLLQGIAYGGEWGGAVVMTYESVPSDRRNFYSSFTLAGNSTGATIGTAVFTLVSLMPTEQLMSWGWRVPFWLGAALVVVGFVIRRKISETPAYQQNKSEAKLPKAPILEVIKTHPVQILFTTIVMGGTTVGAYVALTYSIGYAKSINLPSWVPLVALLVTTGLQIGGMMLAGKLADRFGNIRVVQFGCVYWALTTLALFPAIDTGNPALIIVAYVGSYGVGCALSMGPIPGLFGDAFASRVGYSGVSLGCQLGNLFGGFSPFLAAIVVSGLGVGWLGAMVSVALLLACVCTGGLGRLRSRAATSAEQVPAVA
jgi:MFS transporter, MHS family, shikimate and dehydroshikimate transport protein